MALYLSHKVFRKYIRVTVTGTREPGNEVQEIVSTWSRIADYCEEFQLTRILAILKIKGRLPPQSAFSMQEAFEKTGWKRDYKLAIVASPETLLINILLSEKIWATMGYTMKLFHSPRSARKWLLQASESEFAAKP